MRTATVAIQNNCCCLPVQAEKLTRTELEGCFPSTCCFPLLFVTVFWRMSICIQCILVIAQKLFFFCGWFHDCPVFGRSSPCIFGCESAFQDSFMSRWHPTHHIKAVLFSIYLPGRLGAHLQHYEWFMSLTGRGPLVLIFKVKKNPMWGLDVGPCCAPWAYYLPFSPIITEVEITPNERKLILEGAPIFYFHDYGRKGNPILDTWSVAKLFPAL